MRNDEAVAALIEAPLRRLAECGVKRPESWTLRRFVEVLTEERVLSRANADQYLSLSHRAWYAAVPGSSRRENQAPAGAGLEGPASETEVAELERVVRLLETEIDAFCEAHADEIERVISRLRPQPVTIPLPRPRESDRVFRVRPEDLRSAEPDATGAEPRRFRLASRGLIWLAVGWSLAMLTLGAVGRPWIDDAIAEVSIHVFGRPLISNRERQIRYHRWHVRQKPESLGRWRAYLNFALRRGYSTDATIAYRRLLARDPGNADLMNGLAWLLCTAEEVHVRDPVQALELAERAYALNPAPNIADTLAEAAFQTGDVDRAVHLETDALARAGDNRSFYERQLSKFQAAAESAASPTPSAGGG